MKQRMQVGAACERDWLEAYYDMDVRPYRMRERIIDHHVSKIWRRYNINVTPRAVASWWAMFRKERDINSL
jgi:hypothetical protein